MTANEDNHESIRAVEIRRLRDEFAIAALSSILNDPINTRMRRTNQCAVLAYEFADAMLAARGEN